MPFFHLCDGKSYTESCLHRSYTTCHSFGANSRNVNHQGGKISPRGFCGYEYGGDVGVQISLLIRRNYMGRKSAQLSSSTVAAFSTIIERSSSISARLCIGGLFAASRSYLALVWLSLNRLNQVYSSDWTPLPAMFKSHWIPFSKASIKSKLHYICVKFIIESKSP